MLQPLLHFTIEYLAANQASLPGGQIGCADATQAVGRILKAIQLGIAHGTGPNKYLFGSSHKALRGDPETEDGNEYDFYAFGCDFFRPVMDVERSIVLGQQNLDKAMEYLAQGENVVFLANHQSEADPQVMSVCLEKAGMGKQAEQIVYVAGHKVTTDPLAIPFSMGRNLICIHSKKHIDAEPELKPVKQRQNLSAMGSMLELLKKGRMCSFGSPRPGDVTVAI
jgi:glycerol-3-phosphate O-acyltransferase